MSEGYIITVDRAQAVMREYNERFGQDQAPRPLLNVTAMAILLAKPQSKQEHEQEGFEWNP